MYPIETLSNAPTIREVNSTEINSFLSENSRSRKTQDDTPLPWRATNNQTTLTNKAHVWIYLQ